MVKKEDKTTSEKPEDTEIRETIVGTPPRDFNELKAELKEKLDKKEKSRPEMKSRNLKINVKAAEKEAPTPKPKALAKITPEQMNMLINGVSNSITFIRKTEEVTLEESNQFANALYQVADANGWLDDLNFLPYLVLAASGTQLAIVIMTKPKKPGAEKKVIEHKEEIKQQVQNAPEVPAGSDYDVIDSDKLVSKINGR